MKIILLSPHWGSDHPVVSTLELMDSVVMCASTVPDAMQLLRLHGESVDLVILHREDASGQGEPGISFLTLLKNEPSHADLATIVVTESWNDEQCAEHQNLAIGANAYIHFPCEERYVAEVVSQITGQKIPEDIASGTLKPAAIHIETGMVSPPQQAVNPDLFALGQGIDLTELKIDEVNVPQSPILGIQSFQETETAQPQVEDPSAEFEEVKRDMPYLFDDQNSSAGGVPLPPVSPMGDAVVPGGAHQAPDMETLKKYLFLREQDVAALSSQLKTQKDQISSLEHELQAARGHLQDSEHRRSKFEEEVQQFNSDKDHLNSAFEKDKLELEFKLKEKSDKLSLLQHKVEDALKEKESIRERVRSDIRKIRVRERELENRLEILKKDSEVLLTARENKIIELKRKIDLLEFNMDILHDQVAQEKTANEDLRQRLAKASQAMRLAGGLLDELPSGANATAEGRSHEEEIA